MYGDEGRSETQQSDSYEHDAGRVQGGPQNTGGVPHLDTQFFLIGNPCSTEFTTRTSLPLDSTLVHVDMYICLVFTSYPHVFNVWKQEIKPPVLVSIHILVIIVEEYTKV